MSQLYPLFLKLEGKTVLIVGGGKLALHKWRTLEETGADVVAVAPAVNLELARAAEEGKLTLLRKAFEPADLAGADLVYAATDNPELNREIYQAASGAGILANAVDDPDNCDFYTPSVFRREALTLAISTSGNFPGLSKALREALEEWLPEEEGDLLLELFAMRRALRGKKRGSRFATEARAARLREMMEQFKRDFLSPPVPGEREVAAPSN